jgi:hypothetical protein
VVLPSDMSGVDGTWVLREHGPGLTGIDGELAVDEIYRKVSLE